MISIHRSEGLFGSFCATSRRKFLLPGCPSSGFCSGPRTDRKQTTRCRCFPQTVSQGFGEDRASACCERRRGCFSIIPSRDMLDASIWILPIAALFVALSKGKSTGGGHLDQHLDTSTPWRLYRKTGASARLLQGAVAMGPMPAGLWLQLFLSFLGQRVQCCLGICTVILFCFVSSCFHSLGFHKIEAPPLLKLAGTDGRG